VPVISDAVPDHDDTGAAMPKLRFDITMSLDGFIAGPNRRLEQPLGDGGERLHQWAYGPESFRERHGLEGGTSNRDAEILEGSLADHGAAIMGRRMFGGGDGPWDESWTGWWGRTTLPHAGVRPRPSPTSGTASCGRPREHRVGRPQSRT
jgi:hypothetical protein